MFNKFSKEEVEKTLKILILNSEYEELYFTGGTHIIFEDGNCTRNDIKYCKERSLEFGNLNCYMICCLLETFENEEEIKGFINDIYEGAYCES